MFYVCSTCYLPQRSFYTCLSVILVTGGGRAWPGGGRVWQGACMVVETATAAGGTHPTGMYSCLMFKIEAAFKQSSSVLQTKIILTGNIM